MSRIGKNPINVPANVKIKISGSTVSVEGPKGKLSRTFSNECTITHQENEKQLLVTRSNNETNIRALHGLTRALLFNMVHGVSDGYKKELTIIGVGYKADVNDKGLVLNLGYSNPVEFALPKGVSAKVEEKNTKIILESFDKELLGLTASKIRDIRPPEPYKGKGVRYTNERVMKKAGKTGS